MKIVSLFTCLLAMLFSASSWAAAKPIPDPPTLSATSYFLFDFDSGRVLAEKNPDDHVEPASITKLMTAYLVDKAIAAGDITLDEMVTISEKAWRMKGSKMFVEVGKQVSVDDCSGV
jgi:D-alanyl-D-alanine carboxypeptidase (penicillin-binding protein 5/6)